MFIFSKNKRQIKNSFTIPCKMELLYEKRCKGTGKVIPHTVSNKIEIKRHTVI